MTALSFVATSLLLSRQKTCFCRPKHVFVATKMILVVAPANDTGVSILALVQPYDGADLYCTANVQIY